MNLKYAIVITAALAVSPANGQSGGESAEEAAEQAAMAAESAAEGAAEDAVEDAPYAVEDSAEATAYVDYPEYRPMPYPRDFSVLYPRDADYPPASWIAGEEGDVGYELYVDAEGNVSACAITFSSGFPALDEKTCDILTERASFEPALDDNGEAIEGVFASRLTWNRNEPEMGGPLTIHVAYTVTAEGLVEDCETIEISGKISAGMQRTLADEPCPNMNDPARAPYRDENGVPIDKRLELKIVLGTSDVDTSEVAP